MTRKRVANHILQAAAPQGPVNADALAGDIQRLISEARAGLAATVNAALTMLYWRIGQRIRSEVLGGERAEYGEQIVVSPVAATGGGAWSWLQCQEFASHAALR